MPCPPRHSRGCCELSTRGPHRRCFYQSSSAFISGAVALTIRPRIPIFHFLSSIFAFPGPAFISGAFDLRTVLASPLHLSMDFSLSSDQILIRDTVRQFMETEMRPILREFEREEKFPIDQLKKLGELGCCGMLIPEEWGGAGTDTVSYALMLEEVARVDASTAVALSVTNSVVTVPLWKSGTEAQKKKYLPRLSRGEILGAFCLTEPQAGSDDAGIQTRAVRDGNHYGLNGTKAWVTNGGVSGLYIIFAKTDPAAGSRGVTAFLVEPDFPGFRITRYEDKMGLRLSHSAEVHFENCRVPAENLLGVEGEGLRVALGALDGGRIGIAAQAVGLAQGALEAATKFAKQRRAFGKNISEYQAIQWMLADMQTEIEAGRALTHYAAWVRDSGGDRKS